LLAGSRLDTLTVTFADGHAEIHRWRSAEVLRSQQMGTQRTKWEFMNVAATNPDLVWLRRHAKE
jgi:prepilin-type processing-associated H-X9-DG protein